MKTLVVGLGGVGSIVAGRVIDAADVLAVCDVNGGAVDQLNAQYPRTQFDVVEAPLGDAEVEVAVLCGPGGSHAAVARELLDRGIHVVSVSDDLAETQELLELDPIAEKAGLSLVVGAGFIPGLSCLVARFAGDQLDEVTQVNVSQYGTGGPSCARSNHRSLSGASQCWYDGQWRSRRGGTGRLLEWFPEPVGAKDCYLGALASPILLRQAFPGAMRIVARTEANRRDRLTCRLPMLRPPHKDGSPGAIRVEVQGVSDGEVRTLVYGSVDSPAKAAAVVAERVRTFVAAGVMPTGAYGLAAIDNHADLLESVVESGVKLLKFG